MKCPNRVESQSGVAHPCDVEYEPPANGHLGPCESAAVPRSQRERATWRDKQAAIQRAAEAALRDAGQEPPRASWEHMTGDPAGRTVGPRPHPQDYRKPREPVVIPDQVVVDDAPAEGPVEWDLTPPPGVGDPNVQDSMVVQLTHRLAQQTMHANALREALEDVCAREHVKLAWDAEGHPVINYGSPSE